MQDLLGRTLKDGDMCIGMAIGRNSSGMHLGIFQGSSVIYLTYDKEHITRSCTSNTYLIANPTKEELEVKNKIEELLLEQENKKKEKAKIKTLPLSKLEVGGIYESTQGQHYIYLGKRTVTFTALESKLERIEEGHCFVYFYLSDNSTDEDILESLLHINTYKYSHNIDVLKGNKKLTKLVRKIDLEFPLVKENKIDNTWHYRNEHFKLTIE